MIKRFVTSIHLDRIIELEGRLIGDNFFVNSGITPRFPADLPRHIKFEKDEHFATAQEATEARVAKITDRISDHHEKIQYHQSEVYRFNAILKASLG